MNAQHRQTRQAIEVRLTSASRDELIQALRDVLDVTEEAQRPIDYGDYGIGQWQRDVRVGVAEEVERGIRDALGA